MATAKHRAHRPLRRNARCSSASTTQLGHEIEAAQRAARPDLDAALDDDVGDDLLRLVFIACHPVLSTEARVALTLRLLGGLDDRRDRARLPRPGADDRAADRARQAHARRGAACRSRCRAARELADAARRRCSRSSTSSSTRATRPPRGDDWMRPALCEDALRLGRILAGLTPREPEVHGLVALMEIQASRARARVGPGRASRSCCSTRTARAGTGCSIRRGLAALARAESARRRARAVRAAGRDRRLPRARARRPEDTDWPRIAALYDALARARAVAGRRAQPRGRGRDGVRPGRGPRARRRAGRRAGARAATTCCRACAATCSPSSAATTRRAPSSSAPRR